MNKRLSQFVLPVLLFAFAGVAQAQQTIINFGELGSSFFTTTPNYVLYADPNLPAYDGGGVKSVATATGNDWVAVARYEPLLPTFFYATAAFNLDFLWLAGAWGNQTLTIKGYDANAGELYSKDVYVTTAAARVDFDFVNITSFSITIGNDFVPTVPGATGKAWALGSVAISPVPEPETYAMLLAGLGLIGAVARRRQKALRS